MCLVNWTRCWPRLTHVGNIPLQLLRCTSGQGVVSRVGQDMPVYVYLSVNALRTCLWHRAKGLTILKSSLLQCFSVVSKDVISGQSLICQMQCRNITESFFNGDVDARHFVVISRLRCWPSIVQQPRFAFGGAPGQREEPPTKGGIVKI